MSAGDLHRRYAAVFRIWAATLDELPEGYESVDALADDQADWFAAELAKQPVYRSGNAPIADPDKIVIMSVDQLFHGPTP